MKSPKLSYAPLADESDLPAASRLISHAFASPPDKAAEWLRFGGLENVRVVKPARGQPEACLMRIPMGQYFGGRSVPTVGIAGVAVAPESRGQGLALTLMNECIREIARAGVPLSALYASTQSLYRQVGYEQGGHRFSTSIDLASIGIKDRALKVRELTDADDNAVRACHHRFASCFNGPLDRGSYIWKRIRKMREDSYQGFGIDNERGDGLDGYLFLTQPRDPLTGRHDVQLSDFAFLNHYAGRRLLGFLGDYSTMGQKLSFFGSPMHPAVTLLPQQTFDVLKRDYWMIRLVNLKAAIEARGFAQTLDLTFTLDITDELLPENQGRWSVRINQGRASVKREHATVKARGKDRGALRADIRGLAPIYTGLYSATQGSMLGLLGGDADSLAIADAAFAGTTPWMSDMF